VIVRIAVIGAGPAGLTAAKQALAGGNDVVVFEQTHDVGGIWNPASGGAYEGVRMQSSRMSFPFSDYPPVGTSAFATLAEVHQYLRGYAEHFDVLPVIRFGAPVTRLAKHGDRWWVTAGPDSSAAPEGFDAALVATGELWRSRMPDSCPPASAGVRILSAKQYRDPGQLSGQRVLVVGGGVSGADIASEGTTVTSTVDWSVRRRALFLPRECAGVDNDALFSYAGRVAVEELPYSQYLAWLERLLPAYMAAYRETGLLPEDGFHHAVHINEKIIPAVRQGAVRVRPAFERFAADGCVIFTDSQRARYDTVVMCLGYEMPDYSFIEGLRREELYEHHFYVRDPTLAVINTPVDTDAFGTACPYFEMVSAWVLAVLSAKVELPSTAAMTAWCVRHMGNLTQRRHLDCWLETIRIGLACGSLPDPRTAFDEYWTIVSSVVDPANLRPGTAVPRPAPYDRALVDLNAVKHRILASLPRPSRDGLLASGAITADDHQAAATVPAHRQIQPWLPYRQRS
jgi:dimethylaniline monooxygenase (N-oxide forming)